MAYLALLWKARTIEKYRLKYEKEKINSINSTKTDLRGSLYQKWIVYRNDSEKKLQRICSSCCPEGSKLANSCSFLKDNSSFLLKIVIGIVSGILTYFLFIFVYKISVWSVIGWAVSLAILLGVVCSCRIRCLVLLLVPGLFSRVGRYTLACYALVLILTGPAANTLKNLDTLSQSLACGQEQIKCSVKELKESQDSPLNLVKETMSDTVEKIEYLAGRMKDLMVVIHRLTMSIAHVLQSSLSWLNSVEVVCNTKLGTPYEHCAQVLTQGAMDAETKFPEFASQWNWDVIFQSACFSLKPMEPLCVVGDFAKGSIIATVKKKLKLYFDRIQSMFSMGMHIRRSHSCCSNGSLPVSQAAAGIVTDLRNRADTLLAWLSWTCALTGLFLMLIIFRAKYYLHMFRTRSRFDNRYVTKELRELDLKRQRQGRETVLPLNTRERAKYVSTASFRLLPSERIYLARSIVFMVITTLKLMIHMVADYSLYWVLMNVRFRGDGSSQHVSPSNRTAKIRVSGSGPLAATVRLLTEALSVPLVLPAASTTVCLPDPNPPDLQRYAQIGALILLLWVLALFEPYGLRLRHVISGHYQPERAKARAVWLYYHIIRTRSCFLKYARRKLHRQYKYTSEEKLTFKRRLHDWIPCNWLRILLRVNPAEPHCLLCYTKHRQDDLDRHLKTCDTLSCPGVFCARCFMDIGQLCTICYSPADYGDLSDVSLEKFSSDDSHSDSDGFGDDDIDDNKPLMGTRNCEDKEDRNGTQGKYIEKNKRDVFLTSKKKNGNQESMPLLDGDYLKKDYNQLPMIQLKCNIISPKQDEDSTQKIVTELNNTTIDIKLENISNAVAENDFLNENFKFKMVFKDSVVSVNGITFPKRKLGAVVRTMSLLTSKDYDKSKSNVNIKHKPFEYLVMEMFQPFLMLQKIISKTYCKSLNRSHSRIEYNNERFKNEFQYSFDTPAFAKSMLNSKDLVSTDFNFKNSESVMKFLLGNFHGTNMYENVPNQYKNISTRRKVRRFLDMKKMITTNVGERLCKSRIYYNKHKCTYKRRRRKNKLYKSIRLTKMVSKVFNIQSVIKHQPLTNAIDINIEGNEPRKMTNRKTNSQFSKIEKVIQETGCSLKNSIYNLSYTVTDGTRDNIQTTGERNDDCPSREIDENNDTEIDNNANKTMEQKIQQKNTKTLGFWKSLRVRRRKNNSPRLFSVNLKKDPSFCNFFSNYKRRKKPQNSDHTKKVDDDNAQLRNVNDSVRTYRLGMCLKDDQLYRNMAKYNGIMSMENNELLLDQDFKVVHESERHKNEQAHNANQEIPSTWSNEKLKDKRDCGVRASKEFIIIYDDQAIEVSPKSSGKLSQISKKLKTTLSQIACNLTKKNKRARTVAFSDVIVRDSQPDIYNESTNWEYRVESNIDLQLKRESPHHIFKYLKDESSSDDTGSEDNIPIELLLDCQTKPVDSVESEISCTDIKPHLAGAACNHEWIVEPKKQEGCQTKDNDSEESLSEASIHNIHRCFQVNIKPEEKVPSSLSHGSSFKSLENSKRTQIKNTCRCGHLLLSDTFDEDVIKLQGRTCQCDPSTCQARLRSCSMKNTETQSPSTYGLLPCPNIPKHSQCLIESDQYISAVRMNCQTIQNRTCQCDPSTCQARLRSCSMKNTETQSPSTYGSAIPSVETEPGSPVSPPSPSSLQRQIYYPLWGRPINSDSPSMEIEPEYPITSAARYLRSTFNPIKGGIIKEVTERLIWPSDSTVSQVRLDYADERMQKPKRTRGNVPLMSNRSTTTVTKAVADVSTITSDWWSPILERKAMLTKLRNDMEERKRCATAAKWGSSFYLGDSGCALSAYNYLLESQQCYSMKMGSSRGSRSNKRSDSDKSTRKDSRNPHIRKGKTKRLKECYSSKKELQSSSVNLAPAKWRPVVTEEQAHALKYYTRRTPKKKKSRRPRSDREDSEEEPCKDSPVVDSVVTRDGPEQTNSNMWTTSIFSNSY